MRDEEDAGQWRVAIVGSGPSGIYSALALTKAIPGAGIDVIDRMPAPFGLVRYGVAPDHVKIKSVTRVLEKPFDAGRVRFLGNVEVGVDVTPEELRRSYDAVIYATGCGVDRELSIPGANLQGHLGSAEFVGWYSGYSPYANLKPILGHADAVVIGGGNVALDVARVLAKAAEEMAPTDVPQPVLGALSESRIDDIHVVVRRGPADVQFTPVELLQLLSLENADVVLHDDGVLDQLVEPSDQHSPRGVGVLELLRRIPNAATAPPRTKNRRIHLRLLRSPAALGGDRHVQEVVLEQNRLAPDGTVSPTGNLEKLSAGLVIRAIGYRAAPMSGLPFDEGTGTVPNSGGRMLDGGVQVPGAYVVGWAKRGPSGVIGSNKADAEETVAALVADLESRSSKAEAAPHSLDQLLLQRGVRWVDWSAWKRLDAAEVSLGQRRGAGRVKIAEWDEMLRIALDATDQLAI